MVLFRTASTGADYTIKDESGHTVLSWWDDYFLNKEVALAAIKHIKAFEQVVATTVYSFTFAYYLVAEYLSDLF